MNKSLDYIELSQIKLSEKTATAVKTIIKETDTYLSSFSIFSSFSFSNPDIEKCENDFMNFLLKISEKISELTALNAELASLIIAADKAAKIEVTLLLQKRFDTFCIFEKALYELTSNIEKAFLNKKISISFIVSATQKFKIAAECLLKENT